MIKTSVNGLQAVKQALNDELKKLTEGNQFVLVGIHEGEGSTEDGGISMAHLGAVHEYGATINHPGGTPYGYKTEDDAKKGSVRFLKKGEGFMVLGVTDPHQIEIPARPWLAPGVEDGSEDYLKIIEHGIANDTNKDAILNQVGATAVSKAQEQINAVRNPPNAPSTIRKKGSANPLVDTKAMAQSVHYSLTDKKPDEGLE